MTELSRLGGSIALRRRGRAPIIDLPELFPGRLIAAIAVLFALAYGASLVLIPKPDGRMLIGDALHHYVQLRSMVFDADLQFQNEYVRMYGLEGGEPGTEWIYERTPTGHTRNLMPVGPALLWAPAFLAVTLLVWMANAAGNAYPLDGYARLFQATAGFSGVAAAAAGVWLAFRAARELVSGRAAIWASVVMWLASSAVYYSVVSPTYSHAASLLATSAFWFAFVRARHTPDARRFATLGALAGFSALMRWQDALLLAVVALDLLHRIRSRQLTVSRAGAFGAVSLVAAAVVFAPQMFVWQALYGQLLAIPQGAGFMRWTEPAMLLVLFSDYHGLLTWTPVVALGLAGLLPLAHRDRLVAAAAVAFFVLSWYVNAAAGDWWAGEAFGARRFVSCFPVLVLGLAALIDRRAPSRAALVSSSAIVVAYTFLLLVQYQAFMKGLRDIVPYPHGAYGLWLARFVVPFDLLEWWLER